MGPQRLLRMVLVAGALLVIAAGAVMLATGSEAGWFLVGFGVLDLLTLPLVLRTISRGSRTSGIRKPSDPAAPVDLSADPSDNPYARED